MNGRASGASGNPPFTAAFVGAPVQRRFARTVAACAASVAAHAHRMTCRVPGFPRSIPTPFHHSALFRARHPPRPGVPCASKVLNIIPWKWAWEGACPHAPQAAGLYAARHFPQIRSTAIARPSQHFGGWGQPPSRGGVRGRARVLTRRKPRALTPPGISRRFAARQERNRKQGTKPHKSHT